MLYIIQQQFLKAYKDRYGRLIEGVSTEVVTWRLEVAGESSFSSFDFIESQVTHESMHPEGSRLMYFSGVGRIEVPYYRRASLPTGFSAPGPLVVEESGSTTIVPPQSRLDINSSRCLVIRL